MGALATIRTTDSGQVVLLPEGIRFDAGEVRIRREGRKVILEPVEESWDWLDTLEPLDADAEAVALDRPGTDSFDRPDLQLD